MTSFDTHAVFIPAAPVALAARPRRSASRDGR